MLAAEPLHGKDRMMFTQERKKAVLKNKDNNNNSGVVRNKYGTGVRSYLVNSGLDNSKIGYHDNKVTYNGKAVLSPNIVVNGTSYADEDSLRTLALDLHRSEGKDLVSALDYAAKETGIKNAASIDNGYVAVGDNLMKATVASDGNAYVQRDEMDKAMDEYKEDIDYMSEKDIYNRWEADYGNKIKNAINDILEDEWEYSLEDDPAYQAYAKMYKLEGERAYADAYGNLISNTGGYTNSAALTAANQGLNNYLKQLSNLIPQLMAEDYERYSKDREIKLSAIGELSDFSDTAYEKLYSANSDYLERLNEANMQNYEQRVASDKAELDERVTESELYNNYLESEKDLIDLEYLPKEYEASISQAAIKKALDEIELEYSDELYEEELKAKRKDNILKDLEAKYFLW